MINQILINGEWVDGEPTIEGEHYRIKIPVGGKFGFQSAIFTLAPQTEPEKQIQLRDLGELLPDAVLLEIKDIETDKLEPAAKRRAASRIVTRIHSNVTVSKTQVADLLSKLVANTALTQNQSDTILTALTA